MGSLLREAFATKAGELGCLKAQRVVGMRMFWREATVGELEPLDLGGGAEKGETQSWCLW